MTTFFARALFLVGLFLVVALPVSADEPTPPADAEIFDITFPVAGPNQFSDTWDEARSGGRSHQGTDIMADKMIPVIAAADGVVGWIGTTCCYFEIDHDGFETWYIHLNNDTEGTDDGLGWGIAEGIVPGAEVKAGQLIGWVGDSGNAEWAGPHLHFEIRVDGVAHNSYWSLLEASPPPADITVYPWNGRFSDDDDSVHEPSIDELASDGATRGCNPPENTMYCPGDWVSRGHIAAFINRALELPPTTSDYYSDDDGTTFEADINAVTEAGIGFGCSAESFCQFDPLLREEMAEMLIRAFAPEQPDLFANADGTDFFLDDEESGYEESINRLMAAGVTRGCNPPANDRFCPSDPLTRAQMASFFVRALGR
ncbi:hypothetical protein BH23ACT4_BH23ACT4_17370 [soil metagenome]